MSIVSKAFGIGFTVGLGLSALLGAPLVPALFYGLLTGTVSAAIAAAPPVHARVAVISRPSIFTRAYWGPVFTPGPRVVRPVGGVRVLPSHPPAPAAGGSFFRGWFPSSTAGSTTVHRPAGSSRPFAATTAASGLGTRHTGASAIPAHATGVRATRTMFSR